MEKNSDRNAHYYAQKYTHTHTHTSSIPTDEDFALCFAVFMHLFFFLPKNVRPKISPYLFSNCTPIGIQTGNCYSGGRDLYLANPIYITASLSFGLFQSQVSGKEQINSRYRWKAAPGSLSRALFGRNGCSSY